MRKTLRIHRKQVIGGLTREYYAAALPPRDATKKAGHHPQSCFRAPQVITGLSIAGRGGDLPWDRREDLGL